MYRHRGTSRGSKEHVEHEIEAILCPRVFSVALFRNLVPRPRVFSQAREKTLGTRLTISGNFGVVFARVVPGQSSSPSLPLIISLHLSELIYLWPVVGYAFTFLYINFLPIFPSFSSNLKVWIRHCWYRNIIISKNPWIRGTQREYSSKPLKRSIVKRVLVFKR